MKQETPTNPKTNPETLNELRKTSRKMHNFAQRNAVKTQLPATQNKGSNYLSKEIIDSVSSVKKDKMTFDKLIAKTLLNIIMNGETDKIKLEAIDRFQKLTAQNLLKIQSGGTKLIADTNGVETLNLDFSMHKSDEPIEDFSKTQGRDLIRDKNIEDSIEDAEFEVING